jgi:pimeloyl-ACP methyl ester carboxylesterase
MKTIIAAAVMLLAMSTHAEPIDAGNTRVRVIKSGKPDGPVLVLLHGIGSSLETWNGWASRLGDTYRIIRLDLPGSGETPQPEPDLPHIDDDLAVVKQVLARLGITRFSVAGNSRGGWLAWLLARDPDQVEKLILISPIGIHPASAPPDRVPAIGRFVVRHWLPRFVTAAVIRSAYGDQPPRPEVVDRYWHMQRRDHNREAVDARTRAMNFVDHADDLSAINVPTLILWGKEDHWLDAADACRFHNAIQGSQLVVLPRLGHLAMEESPDTTADLARRFLEGTPLPDGLETKCERMRPSRLLAQAARHAEADLSTKEIAEREKTVFEFERRKVFVVKSKEHDGPPVILLHELPGITRNTFRLADEIAAKGYIVYLPVLSGTPGIHREGALYTLSIAFSPFLQGLRRHHTTPAAEYVVRLADHIHKEHPGNMGVIGMCMTGNIPLATLRRDFVKAAVLAQPSLPFFSRRDLGVSKGDIERAKDRAETIFALRFSHDAISHWERQEALEIALGIKFLTLNSSPGNPAKYSDHAHATLTFEHFDHHHEYDETQGAFDQVIAHLDRQLKEKSPRDRNASSLRSTDTLRRTTGEHRRICQKPPGPILRAWLRITKRRKPDVIGECKIRLAAISPPHVAASH